VPRGLARAHKKQPTDRERNLVFGIHQGSTRVPQVGVEEHQQMEDC
jgi:hypothetical protein